MNPEAWLTVLEESVVTKLADHYVLAVHPYPVVENQLFVFQIHPADRRAPRPQDEEGYNQEEMRVRDYSLQPRLGRPALPEKKLFMIEERMLDRDTRNSLMRVREVNLKMPLHSLDWRNWYTVVAEVSGLGFAQFLPVGHKSDFPLVANTLNVLCDGSPELKHLLSRFPLDLMIQSRAEWLTAAYHQMLENPRADGYSPEEEA